ncbi:hypothetical protein ACTI_73860 [Actinoplanes sp. OR16]|nr:hypothetical protein ACTI_73860 [Actinoplanes sp. OR16]
MAGAVAVIAGRNDVLGVAPLRWVGKLSYGWYLWHWPVLMIWPAALVRDPSTGLNLVFAAGALLLALVTYHLVENPLRAQPGLRARAYRGLLAGLAFSLLTVAVTVVGGRFTPPLPTGPAVADTAAELSAAADPQARLTELITASSGAFRMPSNLTPALLEAGSEAPGHYAGECHQTYQGIVLHPCVYGDPAGGRTVFLIGDSHAAHWFPAVDTAARTEGWRLVALTKAACQMPSIRNFSGALKRPYDECVQWREAVLKRVLTEKPDLVVISSSDNDNGGLVDDAGKVLPHAGTRYPGRRPRSVALRRRHLPARHRQRARLPGHQPHVGGLFAGSGAPRTEDGLQLPRCSCRKVTARDQASFAASGS